MTKQYVECATTWTIATRDAPCLFRYRRHCRRDCALLFAPKSGRELRGDLADVTRKALIARATAGNSARKRASIRSGARARRGIVRFGGGQTGDLAVRARGGRAPW